MTRHPLRPLALCTVLAAGTWLSACANLPEEAAAVPDVRPAEKADNPTVRDGTRHPPAVALRPPIDDDPERLMGLDREGLSDLLGAPNLVRRDRPAEIWQYRAEDCVFDVFLYDEGGWYQVSYLEARDTEARKTDARSCLNRLLRAQAG